MAGKTEGEEKIFLFNLFCKDMKGMEEMLTKTSPSFVTLGTILLLSRLQFSSFTNEGVGLLYVLN